MKFIRMKNRNGLNDCIVNVHLLTKVHKGNNYHPSIKYCTADGNISEEEFSHVIDRDSRFEEINTMLEAK